MPGDAVDPKRERSGTGSAAPRESRASRAEQTRDRILEAAQEVFGTQGYHAASIVDITRRAGVGLGTLYVYFSSKLEIYRQVLRSRQAEFIHAARLASVGVDDPRESVRRAFRTFFDWVAAHPTIMRMLREAEFIDPSLITDFYRLPAERYRDGLERAMAHGYVARTDPDVLAWCVMGMAEFSAVRWIVWSGEAMPGERFDAFVEIILRAMGVDAPRASSA